MGMKLYSLQSICKCLFQDNFTLQFPWKYGSHPGYIPGKLLTDLYHIVV